MGTQDDAEVRRVFQKRISFTGNVEPVLIEICKRYKLDEYKSYELILIGYEDFNLILKTRKDNYFVKILASYRTRADCQRYIEIIKESIAHGVQHPKLLKCSTGLLCCIKKGKGALRLFVTEFIDWQSFYESGINVNNKEAKFLIRQVAFINSVKLKPKFIYDSWAISNFLKEYNKKKQYLSAKDRKVIDLLAKQFSRLSFGKFPHCLVHGDIHRANVLKDKKGQLFIIDFSVANYYPRIQELAVLLCSILFDEKHPENAESQRRFALAEYQKYIPLTKYELDCFSLYCDVAHAMHVLQATYEQEKNRNTSKENSYWLNLGRIGLGTNFRA